MKRYYASSTRAKVVIIWWNQREGKRNNLILNTANIVQAKEVIVVTADVEEDTIYLSVENDDKEMIELDEVVV